MLLSNLKLECLRLATTTEEHLEKTNLEAYESDDNYASIIRNIVGSINRALQVVAMRGKFAPMHYKIDNQTDYEESYKGRKYKIFNSTASLIEPKYVSKILSVRYVKGHYFEEIDYKIEFPYIILPKLQIEPDSGLASDYFIIEYAPLPQIPYTTRTENDEIYDADLLEEFGITDEIANIIPYFVKGDLTESDNINASTLARNTFDMYLDYIEPPYDSNLRVKDEYEV